MRWSEEKIKILREKYPTGNLKELAEEFGINYTALKTKARVLGISSIKRNKRFKLEKLFENTPEAYYWQGFLMADGYISKNGRLGLALAKKDKEHLEKFKNFIGHGKLALRSGDKSLGGEYYEYKCMDVVNGNRFNQSFHIIDKKTYNPPNLDCLDSDWKFISFFIGFFDGDGCRGFSKLGKMNMMKISVHGSWLETLSNISDRIKIYLDIDCSVSMTKRGMANLTIFKEFNFKLFEDFVEEHKLPVLERKWRIKL
jgi:hypothetical protein